MSTYLPHINPVSPSSNSISYHPFSNAFNTFTLSSFTLFPTISYDVAGPFLIFNLSAVTSPAKVIYCPFVHAIFPSSISILYHPFFIDNKSIPSFFENDPIISYEVDGPLLTFNLSVFTTATDSFVATSLLLCANTAPVFNIVSIAIVATVVVFKYLIIIFPPSF